MKCHGQYFKAFLNTLQDATEEKEGSIQQKPLAVFAFKNEQKNKPPYTNY